ncbi:MAG: hypothetical protein HRU29_14465 [Rhizobiales bacterium]|nr:hypothetical protein [Hyphomicrobiales bacterium]NRB15598.1 hypothetical protein [Hyphomicrobiales bacterium]
MKKNMFNKALTGLVASTLIAGAAYAAEIKTVAIANFVDVPTLVETRKGISEGLKKRGTLRKCTWPYCAARFNQVDDLLPWNYPKKYNRH